MPSPRSSPAEAWPSLPCGIAAYLLCKIHKTQKTLKYMELNSGCDLSKHHLLATWLCASLRDMRNGNAFCSRFEWCQYTKTRAFGCLSCTFSGKPCGQHIELSITMWEKLVQVSSRYLLLAGLDHTKARQGELSRFLHFLCSNLGQKVQDLISHLIILLPFFPNICRKKNNMSHNFCIVQWLLWCRSSSNLLHLPTP